VWVTWTIAVLEGAKARAIHDLIITSIDRGELSLGEAEQLFEIKPEEFAPRTGGSVPLDRFTESCRRISFPSPGSEVNPSIQEKEGRCRST
jgi:hypothetical protein